MALEHSIPSLGGDGDEIHEHSGNKISPPFFLEPENAYMQQICRLKVGAQPWCHFKVFGCIP